MAVSRVARVLVAALAVPLGSASEGQALANPIRKVVTMLQSMQKKVTEEGERADELFEKFMCYCKSGSRDLSASLEAAEGKMGELGPSIEEAKERKAHAEEEIKSHQADREAAKTAMAEATALREKEKATFDKYMAESNANLAAITKAVAALERGMAGGFLQTRAADVLRQLVAKSKAIEDSDRDTLAAFLSTSNAEQYAPQSGEITGILKTIHDEMSADQADTVATENAAVKSYEELMAAKKKEVSILSKQIEQKLERVAQLGVEIASMQNELGDAAASLEDDKAFLADLKKNCANKADVHAAEQKTRAEEIAALADTIRVLNDDDALDLFKHTLHGASMSFVQVQSGASLRRAEALKLLREVQERTPMGQGRHSLDFISLALSGKKIGFEKVVAMIDKLVESLKQEQVDDDSKKEYCSAQFDSSDDKHKALSRSLADLSTAIDEMKDGIHQAEEDIAALAAGIKALDKAVAEATEQRKAENAEYKDLIANNGAAKELILFARNRLNRFYNPKLYKAAPKRELSREDRIFVNNGGTPPPTEAPGGIANTGISVALLQVAKGSAAPPPPPATAEAYAAKSQESNGVLAMMDLLVKDLEKEITTAEAEERAAQENYEQTMADSAAKRAADTKSLNDREGAKADLEAQLEAASSEHDSASKDMQALEHYISSLHAECDWLLQYFDVRKQARADEIDSLGKAKAVLSGADYALLQRSDAVRARKFLRH